MSEAVVSVGAVVSFAYPTCNRLNVCTSLRRRRVLVECVRDTEIDPVEPWALAKCPDLRRGRFLVSGYDLEVKQPRSFYLSSARSIQLVDACVKRFALYDPLGDGSPLMWWGAPWEEESVSEENVRRGIEAFDRATFSCRRVILSLGVFDYRPAEAADVDSGASAQKA